MEELNTLDLLKSLTLGVNNKINQEQDSEIEYIVDTSLSNKKKKSAPPIVKEVVKEKKLDNISDDFLDTEDFYESEIIEEPFDTIVENKTPLIIEFVCRRRDPNTNNMTNILTGLSLCFVENSNV